MLNELLRKTDALTLADADSQSAPSNPSRCEISRHVPSQWYSTITQSIQRSGNCFIPNGNAFSLLHWETTSTVDHPERGAVRLLYVNDRVHLACYWLGGRTRIAVSNHKQIAEITVRLWNICVCKSRCYPIQTTVCGATDLQNGELWWTSVNRRQRPKWGPANLPTNESIEFSSNYICVYAHVDASPLNVGGTVWVLACTYVFMQVYIHILHVDPSTSRISL